MSALVDVDLVLLSPYTSYVEGQLRKMLDGKIITNIILYSIDRTGSFKIFKVKLPLFLANIKRKLYFCSRSLEQCFVQTNIRSKNR